LGLDTAGLAVGSVPCGLRATIPEVPFFYPRETGRSRRSYGDLMGIYGDLTHQPVVIQKWVDLSMANC